MKEMIGGCCVCSDDRGYDENPIVYCDGHGCNVAVHQACYGIITVPTGPWFCRKCESQERAARVRCELCPQKEGALKRTDVGGWCHVVCALYIPEVSFGSINSMEPIILKKVPQDRYTKSCYVCEEQGRGNKATTGACMQCNYRSGCKHHFHVTCAQSMGLLREESGTKKKVSYCGYCSYHYKKLFSAQKKELTLKFAKPDCEYLFDKVRLDKSKLGDVLVDEGSLGVKIESSSESSIKISGKFTTANFIETTVEESFARFDDGQNFNVCDMKSESTNCFDPFLPSPTISKQVPTVQNKEVDPSFQGVSDANNKLYVPPSSVFVKASSSTLPDSFMKLSHPSLLHSTTNQTSDSSSTSSFPSFGQYMSPSRPNDFSEIRPDNNSNAFGCIKLQDNNENNRRMFKVAKKKLKGEKKQTNRGRKAKDLVLGEPPLLTSPPPLPSNDFTNGVNDNYLPHLQDMTPYQQHIKNQPQQPHFLPRVPIPSLLSSPFPSSIPTLSLDNLENNIGSFPTSMEQLLEAQWQLGSQFLMQQGQKLDISSLLNSLYQLRNENQQLEHTVEQLAARKNHLITVNARLTMPFTNGQPHEHHPMSLKTNKSPIKNEVPSDAHHNNHEKNDIHANNSSSTSKNQQQQQQQQTYSFISNGLVNVVSTPPPPLSINHLLQQQHANPHNKHTTTSSSNYSHPSTAFNNQDKVADHLRRQIFIPQLTQEQQAYIQQIQQSSTSQTKDQQPPNILPFIIPTPPPHSLFPTQHVTIEQNLPNYILPLQNTSKKSYKLPTDK